MNSILQAKQLTANFIDVGVDFDGQIKEKPISYPVYQFSNGLILVPSDTTNDWFFPSGSDIEGNGNQNFVDTEDDEKLIEFTKKQLADSWGNSVREFQDTSCLKLVHQLLCE